MSLSQLRAATAKSSKWFRRYVKVWRDIYIRRISGDQVWFHLQIFIDGMHQHLNMPREIVDRIFPFIDELIELHFRFLEQLRYRQMEQKKVETIADILLEQFSGSVKTSTEFYPRQME